MVEGRRIVSPPLDKEVPIHCGMIDLVMIKMPQVGNTLREAKWHFLPSIEVFQNIMFFISQVGTAHIMTNISTGWPLA